MKAILEGAAFNGQTLDEKQAKGLISQAQDLLDQAHTTANNLN